MTQQPTPTAPPVTGVPGQGDPNTQADPKPKKRKLPEWLQELPALKFQPEEPNEEAPLIDPAQLEQVLADVDPDVAARIRDDIKFLDYELLRLFRVRDHAAKKQQNRYRKYQIAYMLLAMLATLIGAFQALSLASTPGWMPFWAFLETCVALFAVYLSTISGRESPFPLWMTNRRRAEELRREYFRFLTNLPPYDTLEGYRRSMLLSRRAAEINRGDFPQETTS